MIGSPDASASRSLLADWIELRAVFAKHGAGVPDITSIARLTSDEQRARSRDEESNGIVEEEILDTALEELIDRVAEEIDFRSRSLGNEYAFQIARPFNVILKDETALDDPHWTYLFLLVLSGEAAKALPKSDELDAIIRQGRTLFHACASVGVAGLMRNAHTVWFGWPRPESTAFPDALLELCKQLGWGRPKTPPPPGLPTHPKDDGIDVVGWRRFRDKRNGTMLILCQAATGNNWDAKSIVTHAEAFTDWFDVPIYGRATSSIALPFPAHHEVGEYPNEGFDVARLHYLNRVQKTHGVLIDRLRIVESVYDLAQDHANTSTVGGLEKIPELKLWVQNALQAIRKSGQ